MGRRCWQLAVTAVTFIPWMGFVNTSRVTCRFQRPSSEWKVLQPQTTKVAFKMITRSKVNHWWTSVHKVGDSHPLQLLHSNTERSPSVLVKLQPNKTIIICRETNYAWNEMLGKQNIHYRSETLTLISFDGTTECSDFQGSDLRVSIFCRFIYIYQMMLTRFVEHRTDSVSADSVQWDDQYLSRNELHIERNARRTQYP